MPQLRRFALMLTVGITAGACHTNQQSSGGQNDVSPNDTVTTSGPKSETPDTVDSLPHQDVNSPLLWPHDFPTRANPTCDCQPFSELKPQWALDGRTFAEWDTAGIPTNHCATWNPDNWTPWCFCKPHVHPNGRQSTQTWSYCNMEPPLTTGPHAAIENGACISSIETDDTAEISEDGICRSVTVTCEGNDVAIDETGQCHASIVACEGMTVAIDEAGACSSILTPCEGTGVTVDEAGQCVTTIARFSEQHCTGDTVLSPDGTACIAEEIYSKRVRVTLHHNLGDVAQWARWQIYPESPDTVQIRQLAYDGSNTINRISSELSNYWVRDQWTDGLLATVTRTFEITWSPGARFTTTESHRDFQINLGTWLGNQDRTINEYVRTTFDIREGGPHNTLFVTARFPDEAWEAREPTFADCNGVDVTIDPVWGRCVSTLTPMACGEGTQAVNGVCELEENLCEAPADPDHHEPRFTCADEPCHHEATCSNSADGFTCLCPEGRAGSTCTLEVNDTSAIFPALGANSVNRSIACEEATPRFQSSVAFTEEVDCPNNPQSCTFNLAAHNNIVLQAHAPAQQAFKLGAATQARVEWVYTSTSEMPALSDLVSESRLVFEGLHGVAPEITWQSHAVSENGHYFTARIDLKSISEAIFTGLTLRFDYPNTPEDAAQLYLPTLSQSSFSASSFSTEVPLDIVDW